VTEQITYAAAGVDVEAGDKAVELMKASVRRATRPEVLGGLGGFAGMFDATAIARMDRPVLATSTDGVGTKVAIAQAMDIHDTIGFDLVGMVVDDLVVCGAEPLFMTDYIACGQGRPRADRGDRGGIAEPASRPRAHCRWRDRRAPRAARPRRVRRRRRRHRSRRGTPTARPRPRPRRRRGPRMEASSGLHSNGYSLVRRVIAHAGWALDREVAEFGRTLGEELLTPTRVYAADLVDLLRNPSVVAGGGVHGLSHVTGGGLAANLARVLPQGLHARLTGRRGRRQRSSPRSSRSAMCPSQTSSGRSTRVSASSRSSRQMPWPRPPRFWTLAAYRRG
jgi:phosphoribosylformylglycinamidine cyclo-ligase